MYTLKEIIDAWENNYGGDMEKDYPRFFKELKRKYEKIKKRKKPQAPSSKLQAPSAQKQTQLKGKIKIWLKTKLDKL